jgi:flavin reductase (DIM6/NTAB) family NADH-FMN oxidoreductase RutF
MRIRRITCVSDPQNRDADLGVCTYTAVGTEFDPPTFGDNCAGATISNDFDNTSSLAGSVFPAGTTTVTWTVTDASGNTATCSFDVVVSDNEDPTITCVSDPQNRDADLGVCTYTAVGTEFDPPTFGDNCAGATISNDFDNTSSLAGSVFPAGTTTVTWTVTDASGNTATCSFDVVVSDNEDPTITCVSDPQNRDADLGVCTYTAVGTEFDPPTFGDNCAGATISNDFDNTSSLAGSVFPAGTTTVTWTVTDASGNTATVQL